MGCTLTSSVSTNASPWWDEQRFSGAWHEVHRLRWTQTDLRDTAERIEKYLELAPSSRVLDVPCGLGGLARWMAARGHQVLGVDRDPTAIAAAQRMTASTDEERLHFAVDDMRELSAIERFDGAYCWWGSFGYFGEDGDRRTARSLYRALRPHTRAVLEVFTFEGLVPSFQNRTWIDGSETGGSDVQLMQAARLDVAESRLEVDWALIGEGPVQRRQLSIRVYTVREMTVLLREVGFDAVRAVFDPDGEPVTIRPQGGRTVFVAERAS